MHHRPLERTLLNESAGGRWMIQGPLYRPSRLRRTGCAHRWHRWVPDPRRLAAALWHHTGNMNIVAVDLSALDQFESACLATARAELALPPRAWIRGASDLRVG